MRDTARNRESVPVTCRLEMFRDPRGRIIYDREGALVGAVTEVYCEPDTHQARYAEIVLDRRLSQAEPLLLYPLEGLSWSPTGTLFMNDWIGDAIAREVHSYKRTMHLTAYAYETLDQAVQA